MQSLATRGYISVGGSVSPPPTGTDARLYAGETDTTKIRIPLSIIDNDGNLVTGYSPAAHELQTSLSGAALADAAGTLVEIGGGSYYYQGVADDVPQEGFLLVAINKTGYRGIGYRHVVGNAGVVLFPFVITTNGFPATGCDPTDNNALQVSLNGASYANVSISRFGEIGLGAYYYRHPTDDQAGFVAVKVIQTGYDEAIAWGAAETASSAFGGGPVLSNVTPNVTYNIDPATMLQFDVTDAGSTMTVLVPSVIVDPNAPPKIVHDGTDFMPGFKLFSYREVVTDGFRYHILPDTGWAGPPTLRLFAADSDGGSLVV